MSAYQTVSEIKSRIELKEDDFYDQDPTVSFENLLETLEKETRSLINSYKDDVSFTEQTYEEVYQSPDGTTIPLIYPVKKDATDDNGDKILTVWYRRRSDQDWRLLDSRRYYLTDHRLILYDAPTNKFNRGNRGRRYKVRNPLKANLERMTWWDFSRQVKIKYVAGFDPIPDLVKNIQIDLINNILSNLLLDKGIKRMNPSEMESYIQDRAVLTEDIKERLDTITTPHGRTMVV